MRAVEITRFGPPEVLALGERPMPVAGQGEVLVRVQASGVNRPDVLQRMGNYPPPAGASDIPGLEIAGTIEGGDLQAIQQAGFKIGDAVCALVTGGGYAEYCVAPVAQCLPVPQGMSVADAASLPETFFTVYSNMVQRGQLQAGNWVLVHGGSSGIGVTAIQIAKALGANVVVTVGNQAKAQACLALGADAAIDYRQQDFVQEVMRITEGHGADVVLDMVAGDYIARDLRCTAADGRIVVIATQGGTKVELDIGHLYRNRITLTGSTLRVRPVAFKGAIAQALHQNIWPLLEQGSIKPQVFTRFAARDAAQAHALMQSSEHVGKILLLWD